MSDPSTDGGSIRPKLTPASTTAATTAHGPAYYPWDDQPAPIESSGTWLNRGVWYTEVDALILYRVWQRAPTFVGAADQNVIIPDSPPADGLQLQTNRTLYIPSDHPGGDAGVRGTLGRFLFRDDHNRDHTAEFTAWAAGNWVSDGRMTSENPNGLFVTFNLDGGNDLFDRSSFQRTIYSSRLNSFELNYRLKKRLGRDQMVMDPNGNWRREASNGFNRNYLAGFRYVQVNETLDWTAEDIVVNGANGQLPDRHYERSVRFPMRRRARVRIRPLELRHLGQGRPVLERRRLAPATQSHCQRRRRLRSPPVAGGNLLDRRGRGLGPLPRHAQLSRSAPASNSWSSIRSPWRRGRSTSSTQSSWIETGGNPWYMGGLFGFECYW